MIGHGLQRPVIDEDDLSRQPMLAEGGVELLDKKASGSPIVEDRHQDRKWGQSEKFGAEITTSWMETRRR
jgi:hypothetical protein